MLLHAGCDQSRCPDEVNSGYGTPIRTWSGLPLRSNARL